MSVGVVTSAYTRDYQRFLPQWAASVAHLRTAPDQVTIAHHDIDPGVRDEVDALLTVTWVPIPERPQVLAACTNTAIEHTPTTWIVKLDADDLILPHAISALHRITADVYGFGLRMSTGANLPSRPVTAEQVLTSPDNLVFSCSPFRRTVWEANRIADMDMEDWWYWIRAAHAGFTFTASRGVDYIYRVHDQNRSNEYDAEQQRDKVRRMRQDLLA